MATDAEHIDRIVERLRKDHPDPAQREKFYADDKLAAYVGTLMQGHSDDPALLARVIAGVRAAEDGTNPEADEGPPLAF